MLRLVQIRFRERPPDDLVDPGENEVVQRGERDKQLRKGRLVSDVTNPALDVWTAEPLGRYADPLFGR